MSNAIKTSAQQNPASSGATALSDMLNRLGAARPGAAEGSQESFARWMTQHQNQAMPSAQASPAPVAPTRPASSNAAPRAQAPAATVAARASANRPPAAVKADVGQAETGPRPNEARALRGKQEAARSNKPATPEQKDATQASAQADAADEAQDAQGEKDVRFKTASGEGEALVRELTPPPTVRSGDPAGMMAWLMSLTQADASALQEAAGSGLGTEGEAGVGAPAWGALGDEERGGRGLAQGAALGAGGALGLNGLSGLNGLKAGALGAADDGGGLGAASLQVDALLGRGDAALTGEADALPGFMVADGARPGAFGQTLAHLTPARHETATLATPLYAPDFAQKLADQVSLWVGQVRSDGPMTAELHLNPAEMGPINVKISLDGTAAQVDFAAAAQETRQAIESSLSMLSAALNEAGLSLSGGGVSSQTAQQQAFAQGSGPGQGGAGRSLAATPGDGEIQDDVADMRQVAAPRPGRPGGLDLYA